MLTLLNVELDARSSHNEQFEIFEKIIERFQNYAFN